VDAEDHRLRLLASNQHAGQQIEVEAGGDPPERRNSDGTRCW
jgi:hypothetical protein